MTNSIQKQYPAPKAPRPPSIITDRCVRGSGYVAMVWQDGSLLNVKFGSTADEVRALAAGALAAQEQGA